MCCARRSMMSAAVSLGVFSGAPVLAMGGLGRMVRGRIADPKSWVRAWGGAAPPDQDREMACSKPWLRLTTANLAATTVHLRGSRFAIR
jgi:hypothetical protein